ncbi:metalloregulator ArsR/SmtB family transcription factor [Photobacterium sp. SDRW27]|uniref:metalloregulator ArsR/SmtB family transcription factor n=1 Tax=Photobacterium obscurum TaxID=2829490 RepID=UPI002243834A|nr:metalloregulator ArsR/SmtB family transcription factor [Photobacterium obscurum]MCW8327684.1 metalloregulator ArsR/SmtB family transcription factor [Photobacterium obscurum]
MMKKRILFLCTGNSARSQLAEALMRHMAGEHYQVVSAGMKPEGVDPRVYQVLEQHGVCADNLHSISAAELHEQHFDVVITLCDRASNECALFSDSDALIHWDFKDPKSMEGIEGFEEAFEGLQARIALFLMLNGEEQSDVVGPVELFKIMSDPLRLRILMLIEDELALTVGDLTKVLEVSQPKVSRHLALLRDGGVLQDQREGLWIFYRLADQLPVWIRHTLATVRNGNPGLINKEKLKLSQIKDRKKPGFSLKTDTRVSA